MDKNLISEIAENLSMEPSEVASVVNEFTLQLHKRLVEYKGLNGDYIGEDLHYQIDGQAFYHLLGFLDCFSDRYGWESGSATEYLLRLGTRADWLPYKHQMEAWQPLSK